MNSRLFALIPSIDDVLDRSADEGYVDTGELLNLLTDIRRELDRAHCATPMRDRIRAQMDGPAN